MEHVREYPVLVTHTELSNGSAVPRSVSELASALAKLTVRFATSAGDVESAVSRDAGFESEMQGIFPGAGADGRVDDFTCVVPETAVEGG